MTRLDASHSGRQFMRGTAGVTAGCAGLATPRDLSGRSGRGGDDIWPDSRGHDRWHQVFSRNPLWGRYERQKPVMSPQKPVSWSGLWDCTDWGHLAPQHINPNPSEYTKYVGWNNYRGGMSEDCLVVNVWTPGLGITAIVP